ncbi:MAG TPA: serine protease, partial [Fimbriimonadaceae bacterium]|nr:serine protease [Fimbriimonadaceae bacterium]
EVQPFSRTEKARLPAYVLFEFKDDALFFDLAFLIVRDPDSKIAIAQRGLDYLWKEKPVYACGNPREEEFLVDHGSVLPKTLAPKEAQQFSYIVLHDALIEHGNSGGGLFDSEGKLVAINTWLVSEKYGMAIDLDVFDGLFDFRSTSVSASDDWKEDATLASGSSVFMLAVGKWKPRSDWDECASGGFSNGSEDSLLGGFNFGALLGRAGDRTVAFDKTHWGPDKVPVDYPDARIAQMKEVGGPLSFRINRRDPSEASGRMDVFYLILKPQSAEGAGALRLRL